MNKNRLAVSATSVTADSRAMDAVAEAVRKMGPADAERRLADLLAAKTNDADALHLMGVLLQRRGDHAAASNRLREALGLRPDDAAIHHDLAKSLHIMGDLEGAISAFRAATEHSPTSALAWLNLGKVLNQSSLWDQAIAAFERVLECDPSFTEAHGALGDVFKSLGDMEAAAACYRVCLRDREKAPRAWYILANLKTVKLSADDVAALRALAEDPSQSEKDRILIGYALATALEDQREYSSAFAALSAASRLVRRHAKWNSRAFRQHIDAVDAAFARPVAGASDTTMGRGTIFLVSIPRAGSTLTEQIVSAHPQVEGAGELPELSLLIVEESKRRGKPFPHWVADATSADWQRLGQDYLTRTARWGRGTPYFTDKGLDNWSLVGAAAAMLPGARFINCRRDPLETCLSCYRQLFPVGNFFSYDVSELAAFWRDYDRLSRAWRERYPSRFFDAVYEDLLLDPEAQIRRLLAFLGLPFDPACLDFHRHARVVKTLSAGQVRQPLKRDTARAHLYGHALDPMRAALSGAGAEPRPDPRLRGGRHVPDAAS